GRGAACGGGGGSLLGRRGGKGQRLACDGRGGAKYADVSDCTWHAASRRDNVPRCLVRGWHFFGSRNRCCSLIFAKRYWKQTLNWCARVGPLHLWERSEEH